MPMDNEKPSVMKRICVFCGSKQGKRVEYVDAANALGDELARRGIGLVYGGGQIGLMGRIADRVLSQGGEVIGVIPRKLLEKEVAHTRLSKLEVVGDMHERKALMARLSDGFITMPGGLGTFEELFEVTAWAALGFHQKPCAILNVRGYYDALGGVLQQAVDEGFVKAPDIDAIIIDTDAAQLLTKMRTFLDGNR